MSDGQKFYPYEIRDAWQEVIDNLDLAPEETGIISAVIKYSQPPLSFNSLSQAAEVYGNDNEIVIDQSIIEKFNKSNYISHSKPRRIATSHPVFFALTHPAKLGDLSCHVALQARKRLSRAFQDAESGGMVSRSQFYQHTIAVRDVLVTLIKTGWDPEKNTTQDADSTLLTAINSDAMYGQTDDNFSKKIDTLKLIIDGELSPGGVQRKHTRSGGGSRRKKSFKRDEWHEERIEALAQLTKKTPKTIKTSIRQSTEDSKTGNTVFNKMGLHPQQKASSVSAANEGVGDVFYLQREILSSLTPSDDRQLIRYWLAGAPTSSIRSLTDVSRLTPDHINQVMQKPLTPICRIYASLLVCTGLPPLRLTRLTVNEEDTLEVVIRSGDKRPYWLPHLNLLCYRLLDGPVKIDSNPAANWVILHLPESVSSVIIRADSEVKKRPFQGARAELNVQLKKHFKLVPGITPTANRLSASSWLYCRPHAVDDIAAATVSGEFGLGMAAPAAYRRIPRQEHQHIFEHALRALGWNITQSDGTPRSSAETENIDLTTAGSAVARTVDEFSAVFEKLKHGMQSPSASLSGWWAGEPIPLAAVTELHQLVSAYEMLAWHLSTGSRPVGPSSKNDLGQALQWIYDKNSSIGRESRVIPLLATTRNSLELYQDWTNAITTRLGKNGVLVDDQRTGQRQTTSWMEMSKRGKFVRIRDMVWRDMTDLSIIDKENWPSNVCRHSTASWLRQHAPDAQVDQLLGHARHGRMSASPQR